MCVCIYMYEIPNIMWRVINIHVQVLTIYKYIYQITIIYNIINNVIQPINYFINILTCQHVF